LNTIVTEETDHGEIAVDVFQKLSDDRILFISGDLDDNMAADISATLLLKDSEDSEQKVTVFINSRGGDIRNALAIYDVMTMLNCPIETVCIGSAMKEAVILLAAGTPGMRYATKHSIIAASQLINNMVQMSDLTDAKSLLDFLASDNKKMMNIIAKCTNKSFKQVMSDFDRMVFMNSQQALKYGFIDKIVKFNK
jgi:ATP-dependent Clp protease protease subunit